MKLHGLVLLMLGLGLSQYLYAQGIFVCVDEKGRKITSDRPIPECREKEQKELNASGSTKRVVKPAMTDKEKADIEAQSKRETEAKVAQEEERRKNRAFLTRYPNAAAHDKERAAALTQIEEGSKAARSKIKELDEQRKKINEELEFYKKDPSKTPAKVKRQIEDNDASIATQKRFLENQDEQTQRVNKRFDAELDQLRKLWAANAVTDAPTNAPTNAPTYAPAPSSAPVSSKK